MVHQPHVLFPIYSLWGFINNLFFSFGNPRSCLWFFDCKDRIIEWLNSRRGTPNQPDELRLPLVVYDPRRAAAAELNGRTCCSRLGVALRDCCSGLGGALRDWFISGKEFLEDKWAELLFALFCFLFTNFFLYIYVKMIDYYLGPHIFAPPPIASSI